MPTARVIVLEARVRCQYLASIFVRVQLHTLQRGPLYEAKLLMYCGKKEIKSKKRKKKILMVACNLEMRVSIPQISQEARKGGLR